MKVTTIKETHDILSLKVDELIGSLQNFKITINSKTDKKGNSIAFLSNVDTEETQGSHEDDENLSAAIVLLGRQFKRILQQVSRRSRRNGQNIRFNIDNEPNNEKKGRTDEKSTQSKGV